MFWDSPNEFGTRTAKRKAKRSQDDTNQQLDDLVREYSNELAKILVTVEERKHLPKLPGKSVRRSATVNEKRLMDTFRMLGADPSKSTILTEQQKRYFEEKRRSDMAEAPKVAQRVLKNVSNCRHQIVTMKSKNRYPAVIERDLKFLEAAVLEKHSLLEDPDIQAALELRHENGRDCENCF